MAEITVPTDAFIFETVFREFPDAVIELEPVVPIQSKRERKTLLAWIVSPDSDAVKRLLTESSETESVERLMSTDEKTLFEIRWSDDIDGIAQPLFKTAGRCLEAIGTADEWRFRFLFDSHHSLSEFNMAVTSNDIPVTLLKLHNPAFQRSSVESSRGDVKLTDNHTETLLMAYRNGYYASPREHTLDEIAAKDGVTDSALSKRLRRATASLIEHTLLSECN